MKCQFCVDEGQRSTITVGQQSSTCVAGWPGYYDEDGNLRESFDPNWHTTNYFCSRGHHFTITRRQNTPDVLTLVSTLTSADSAFVTNGEATPS